jgi:hypothetical protein
VLQQADEALIDELRSYQEGPHVLSVYLPIRPGLNFPQSYHAELLELLRGLKTTVPEADGHMLETESQRVLKFVRDEYVASGRTLALFSSAPRSLFTAISLHLALPPLARFMPHALVGPLDTVLDDNPRIAIACVDERESQIIVTFLAEVETTTHFKDNVPPRQRQGGWSAFKYERDRVRHIEEHVKATASHLEAMYEEKPFARLVFGGSPELAGIFTGALSSRLKPLVAGTFRVEMFNSVDELVKAALPIALSAELKEEVSLAETIKEKALSRGPASLGWDETLQLLTAGRVHRLALPSSSLGTAQADAALLAAWDSGAQVEFLGAEAAEVLGETDGVGALLRY